MKENPVRNRLPRSFKFLAIVALLLTGFAIAQEQITPGKIWLIEIEGAIGPATSDYVLRGFAEAEAADASVIVVRMNTPGGLDTAMRDIIQAILASDTPIVSYVAPKGARAASAGTYISYASHVAAMAPATNLGAATPVQIGAPSMPTPPMGGDPEEDSPPPEAAMDKKMVNDASAYIIGLAELRGRNVEWAEQAVREAASIDAETALELNVVDLIAEDLDDLIRQLDGRVVKTDSGEQTLALAGQEVHHHEPDWRTEILSIITDPSMVLILGMIGMYGIILEFYNPGSLIPGIIGVICLLLAAYAVQLLPLNYAGLALLALGIGLMVAEALVPSFGILGIGGIIAFSIGGLMLFDTDVEAFQVGLPTITAIGIVFALLIFATINIALKIRQKRVTTGTGVLIGQAGEALSDFGKEGQVRVGAEIWRARSEDDISEGDEISIISIDGLLLTVKKVES